MAKLDCWLPEKEMFGVFHLGAMRSKGDTLELEMYNEVFEFSICFSSGVGAVQMEEAARGRARMDTLNAEYEVYLRGNTFFKLDGSEFLKEVGRAGDVHYLVATPNCTLDILANRAPSVTLDLSPLRRKPMDGVGG